MSTVNITIAIPEETYNRVQRTAPKKEWGENHKRQFYTNVFLKGLESAEYLKAENRRLEKILQITKSFLKAEDQGKADAVEDLARQLEALEDMSQRPKASNGNGAV